MKIRDFIFKHKWLSVVGLLQVAMILLLLVKLPAERCVSKFDFTTNNSSTDNMSVQLDCTPSLRSGAYGITIDYQMQEGANATVSFTTEEKPSALINECISLESGADSAFSRIWVSLGSGVDDLKINLFSDKPCKVTHIEFTEMLKYRVLRIIGYFLLFAFVDALIYLVFSKKYQIKRNLLCLGFWQ